MTATSGDMPRLNDEEMARFHTSLTHCTSTGGFLEKFYKYFLESSPEVREKFSNTNWLRQYRMMVASFHMMVMMEDSDETGHLANVAKVHDAKHHAIPPHLYDNWLESLLKAVSETDPDYDEDMEALWRRVMARGITFMRNRYHG